jgi:hypothetical protein
MAKLKIFILKSDVEYWEKEINDFIKDKKVISTNVLEIELLGMTVWVFYEEKK